MFIFGCVSKRLSNKSVSKCQKDVKFSKDVKMPKICLIVKMMSHSQKDVKLSKRCRNAQKMSNCQNDVKCQKVK